MGAVPEHEAVLGERAQQPQHRGLVHPGQLGQLVECRRAPAQLDRGSAAPVPGSGSPAPPSRSISMSMFASASTCRRAVSSASAGLAHPGGADLRLRPFSARCSQHRVQYVRRRTAAPNRCARSVPGRRTGARGAAPVPPVRRASRRSADRRRTRRRRRPPPPRRPSAPARRRPLPSRSTPRASRWPSLITSNPGAGSSARRSAGSSVPNTRRASSAPTMHQVGRTGQRDDRGRIAVGPQLLAPVHVEADQDPPPPAAGRPAARASGRRRWVTVPR